MKVVATLGVLIASLFLVAWRQGRAFEAVAALDAVQRERVIAELERDDLGRRIEYLEDRSRIVKEARSRLGMRNALDYEIVILSGDAE